MAQSLARQAAPPPTDAPTRRLRALQGTLRELALDALMVVAPENLRYLCGFSGSRGVLVVPARGRAELVVDGRYVLQAAQEAPGVQVRPFAGRDDALAVARSLKRAKACRVAYEAGATTVERYFHYADALSAFSLVPARDLVEAARELKGPEEIALLAAAGAATARAFEAAAAALREGVSELDVAALLGAEMGAAGADGPAFAPLVAFGERSALPHPVPTGRRLRRGDWVLVDAGAMVGGYRADCTRTFVFGEPSAAQRALWEAVAAARAAAVEAVRPGALAWAPARAARRALKAHGFGGPLAHPVGHGLGLEIHEAPFLAPDATERLEAGMALAVEPGLYRPGFGGVRLEDTFVLEAGGPRLLTPAPVALAAPLA